MGEAGCCARAALLRSTCGTRGRCSSFLSRGNVNKHVYGGETFVACESPQRRPKQCDTGPPHTLTLQLCNIAVFFSGGWHTTYPGLLRKNYWRIPIKTGSSHGSETATTPERTTHSPPAPTPLPKAHRKPTVARRG